MGRTGALDPEQAGGSLTDQQIMALVAGMRSRWGRPNDFKDLALPPYSLQDAIASGSGPGDPRRGAEVFRANCAQCHGADGRGGAKGGSVVDPNFLALTSDQSLRTTTIAGRQDLGKPDWRANVPDHPMSPQDISDLVAWLAAQRGNTLAPGREPADGQVSSVVKTADGR
jgi:mono/diheme cytochrome c family protein